VLGISASGVSNHTVLVAGLAGLLAGALSMGAGAYVSVRSQHELLAASTPDPQARQVGNRPPCAPPAKALKNTTMTKQLVAQGLLSLTTPLLFQSHPPDPYPRRHQLRCVDGLRSRTLGAQRRSTRRCRVQKRTGTSGHPRVDHLTQAFLCHTAFRQVAKQSGYLPR